MATNGFDEVGSVVNTSEAHPSRREILVHGSKVAVVRGEGGHDFVDAVGPLEPGIVIDKPSYSAFAHTGLQQVLSKCGIETLIMTGVTTEVCVSSTLRAAIDLGYRCITVSDACASGDPSLHKTALDMIGVEGGIFGEVATTAEAVGRFTRLHRKPPL